MQTLETTTSIPLVDLKKQYDSIKGDVDAAIKAVIEETAFVGGSYVKAFEEAFARYCGGQRRASRQRRQGNAMPSRVGFSTSSAAVWSGTAARARSSRPANSTCWKRS